MTTQHTHNEQNDVDAMVVEHPSAPEASVDPIASKTTNPTEAEVQASTSSTEPDASVAESVETPSDETSASSSVEPLAAPEVADVGQEESSQLTPSVQDESSTTEVPVSQSETGHVDFPYRDVLSKEKEVRPFTAFIEEFRLAEEQARRQVSLPEAPTEAFHLLVPSVEDLSAPVQDDVPVEETTALAEEVTVPVEETALEQAVAVQEQLTVRAAESIEVSTAEGEASAEAAIPSLEVASEPVVEAEQPPTPPVQEAEEPQLQVVSPEPEKVEERSESTTAEKDIPAPQPPERAVSPLLRPASRVRTPRHARHLREEVRAEAPVEPSAAPEAAQAAAVPPLQSEQQVVSEAVSAVSAVSQAPAEEQPAPPRPARRYRFDRPATSNGVTAGSSTRAEENKETVSRVSSSGPLARVEAATGVSEQSADATTKTVSGSLQQAETPASKQQVQESPTQETPSIATPSSPETGRRRGHDRQKETAATSTTTPSIVEPVIPAVEPATMQLEEIAPEDLPPLEYAELQKTTTRRRRRHRSSSSNGSSPSVAAETPATPATPVTPPAPATPPAASAIPTPAPSRPAPGSGHNGSNYSIVSGYTVNQMNQGNDTSGPFMGPDPSPARGSVLSRDGRTTNRAETQRTPTPLYPGRTHSQDGGLTMAALNQLTSTFAQALQNQTDRMVAEMRRSNSAPTSVSVTLPPFPSTERVGVFVDVANLLYSARTLRISVDFGKLLDFLRGNRRLVRAHAYCPTSPQAGDEQMFLQAVKGLGYRITTKNYKTFSSGAKKADLDLDLCMDVVRLVDGRAVDCVVLVSGDSDFMPMLDYCSDHGVRVEVAAFDEAMSATLRQSCDLFVNLSMLQEIRS